MKNLFSMAATAALIVAAAGAVASDPIYEAKAVPITPHQLGVLWSVLRVAHLEEQAPVATLTAAGMPASPHQVAVLAPRPTGQQIAARPAAD